MELYITRIGKRAWVRTMSDIGFRSVRSSIVKFLWVGLALAIMWHFNWDQIFIDRLGEIWAALAALAGVLAAVFAINLLLAPAELQKESDAEIDRLTTELDDKVGRQEALNELWRLRSYGISLRNTPVVSVWGLMVWSGKFHLWRLEVLEKAEAISVNLRNWFERLDRVNQPPSLGFRPFSGRHGTEIRNMSELLLRMQVFLEKDLRWPGGST